ncbi:MAG: glycosyltransferase [Candidatus Kaiserbacteria bacterium]|nr:glycosyltransferase [Candidatus Kaiserbacteria bacterium]
MRLLILTQAVDVEDLYLGFFHRWLLEFSKHFETIEVICLKEGKHALPSNVRVYSLGKERAPSRLRYIRLFYTYLWKLRGEYDAVLVHQNQEYILLGGLLWRLLGKRVYLWRNHYAGTFLTGIAAGLSKKVFCTSRFSYTARYRNNVLMPVGIDTAFFAAQSGVARISRSILFYARLAPSKKPDVFIAALALLKGRGRDFSAVVRGTPLPEFALYLEELTARVREKGLDSMIRFEPGAPNDEGPRIFSTADIFVNLGGSGMYDKMIFEAAACGAIPLAMSKDFAAIADARLAFDGTAESLAARLETILALSESEKESLRAHARSLAEDQSLARLSARLVEELSV